MNAKTPSNHIVYLDNAATTPCDPRVIQEMTPYLTQYFGNPSSPHLLGQLANQKLNDCRTQITKLLYGSGTVIFTSGSTESNNLGVTAALRYSRQQLNRSKVLCMTTEHKSVINSVTYFSEALGVDVVFAPVNRDGSLNLPWLLDNIDNSVGVVIMQLANSETGVIQDVRAVSKVCHKYGAVCLSDITQAVGRIPLHLDDLGVDFASFTAHKFYGPKGVGGLYVAPQMYAAPMFYGGGQERGVRPGTENVAGIVGMTCALQLCIDELHVNSTHMSNLRDQLWNELTTLGGIRWNSCDANVLPSHLNVTIQGVNAQDLMLRLRSIAFSAGSACNAASNLPSPVLLAMGFSKEEAEETIRLTIGKFTTEGDIEIAGRSLVSAIRKIRL